MQVAAKKRFRIEEYIALQRANPIIQNIGLQTQILSCICKTKTEHGKTCFKCKHFVHSCLASSNNREDLYECASCLNKSMDPLFQVKKVLNQSYFRTQSIFQYSNVVNFQFYLKPEDMEFVVEVRGIIPGQVSLSWPMQGGFNINEEKINFHELKPLLINSNRKARREEFFTIPSDKLKIGKNYLKFLIPCLERGKFTSSYQFEEKKEYYFAIDLIKKLSPAELETLTFREHRTDQKASLEILRQNNSDVQITQNKVSLMCPYTRERIKVPIRGRYCRHFSCICLQTLITTHSRTRFWNCPICQYKLNEPYVDIWIYNMLIDNQKGSQVLVKEDGTYQWVKQDFEQMIDIESESEEEESPPFKPEQPQKPEGISQKATLEGPKQSKQGEKKEIEPLDKEPENKNKQGVIDIIDNEEDEHHNSPPQLKLKGASEKNVLPSTNLVQEERNPVSRKQLLLRMKNQINQTLQRSSLSQPNKITQSELEKEKGNSPSFTQSFEKKLANRQNQPRSQSSKPTIIFDIIPMDVKIIKTEEFKKIFSKGKSSNKSKKSIRCEELRRLFKEIL